MDTLILEDFRCFAGRHEVPIRPLTLLVGENSTGKTSFLAGVRAALDRAEPNFNEEPFRLGSYDQIATNRGRPAKSFAVGMQFEFGTSDLPENRASHHEVRVESRFTSKDAQPGISEFCASAGVYRLGAKGLQGEEPELSFSIGDQMVIEQSIPQEIWAERAGHSSSLWSVLTSTISALKPDTAPAREHITSFDVLLFWALHEPSARPYAFAPIRTSPRRTYDPAAEPRRPEGSHIPITLAAWLAGEDKLYSEDLNDFGNASGLYASLGIRRLGKRGSDPFQIEVKPAQGGMARNLIDVGYGVSQAIPIIADCVSASPMAPLLIQQPEVHLHPRAQAAMGSFFGQLAASGRDPVVVETHSDYLVDRVRMDVRDEKIRPSDVMILYFEQGRGGAAIHPIELDAAGRVVDVPEGYRSFFLEEQRRFFGVD